MSLSDLAVLDAMVAVVDSVNFLRDYEEAKFMQETEESRGEDGERSVADLLVDQVEFADVILLNKIDLAEDEQVELGLQVLQDASGRIMAGCTGHTASGVSPRTAEVESFYRSGVLRRVRVRAHIEKLIGL